MAFFIFVIQTMKTKKERLWIIIIIIIFYSANDQDYNDRQSFAVCIWAINPWAIFSFLVKTFIFVIWQLYKKLGRYSHCAWIFRSINTSSDFKSLQMLGADSLINMFEMFH